MVAELQIQGAAKYNIPFDKLTTFFKLGFQFMIANRLRCYGQLAQ
jgi:hypothetical protein